jgi:chitinase
MTPRLFLLIVLFVCAGVVADGQRLAVIGYYAGRPTGIDSFPTDKLTHIIFSFCHLKGNRLDANNARDTTTIRKLVALKRNHPQLKVILSLGGWGGCKTCTDVFSTDSGRKEFAQSVRAMSDYFHTDGVDLDWEYPALENVPDYPYAPQDRDNFTAVVRLLRKTLDRKAEISFAAGGFTQYLQTSIDWKQVAPMVDYINLMSYDLVNGYSTTTGHHTGLYSTPHQVESVDHAVRWLDSAGVPLKKVVIGMAFYARLFRGVDSINNGLYQPCQFFRGVSYRDEATRLSTDSGYVYHWDPVAQAPYKYNARDQIFASFDDTTSIRLKTEYALHKKLGGVMFWQLTDDNFFSGGLVDVIDSTKKERKK